MNNKDRIINKKLIELSKSKFRSSFHLNKSMREYITDKGFKIIKDHAKSFITQKLAPATPQNDGKQTPMKGHPVFIAMHACACCCRSCLEKWHHIPKHKELTTNEQNYVLTLLLTWLTNEYRK